MPHRFSSLPLGSVYVLISDNKAVLWPGSKWCDVSLHATNDLCYCCLDHVLLVGSVLPAIIRSLKDAQRSVTTKVLRTTYPHRLWRLHLWTREDDVGRIDSGHHWMTRPTTWPTVIRQSCLNAEPLERWRPFCRPVLAEVFVC